MTARRTLATVLGAAALTAASALTAAPAQADGPTRSVVSEDFVRSVEPNARSGSRVLVDVKRPPTALQQVDGRFRWCPR